MNNKYCYIFCLARGYNYSQELVYIFTHEFNTVFMTFNMNACIETLSKRCCEWGGGVSAYSNVDANGTAEISTFLPK
jgi:hypothetical protein